MSSFEEFAVLGLAGLGYTVVMDIKSLEFQDAQTVKEMQICQYLTLEEYCTCTRTYQKYADQIDPYPENLEETIPAL